MNLALIDLEPFMYDARKAFKVSVDESIISSTNHKC